MFLLWTHLWLNKGLGSTPANGCECVIEVRFLDSDAAGTAASSVDCSDAAEGILEVDFRPHAIEAVGVVMGLGHGEGSAGED